MPKTSSQNRTAEYKGKKYRLLFLGDTKYGRRANLQFWDGSKNFWVPAELVKEVASTSKSQSKSRYEREDEECELCGRNKYTCGHCIGW